MTFEQFTTFYYQASFEAIIIGLVIFLLAKFLLPSYLSQKGKNLATKEDIEGITKKVESVRSDYAQVLEEIKSDNQLRLAQVDRENNIKKDVYLQSVEALTRTQNVIPNLSNLNINEQEITSEMANDAGVIAKVQIVGSEQTVKAVTTIMAAIGTAILSLMLQRSKLIDRKNQIDLAMSYRTKAHTEIDRHISMLNNMNLEGVQDERLKNVIDRNIEFQIEQRDKCTKEIDEFSKIQSKEHLIFGQQCMDKFFEITSLLPDAVLSVRDELNLPISNEAYLDIFNENTETGKRVFNEFYASLS